MIYDIAVIGLGPAGASFARLIDSGRYRVAAIDRKDPNHPERHAKPCGGLLSPSAQRALARFNLSIPADVIASPQIFHVKTIDMDNRLVNHYQRFYLNINRQRFDLWLMSLIPESVDVYDGSTVTRINRGAEYEIEFRRGERRETIRAKYIVDAGGAHSIVTRTFFKNDMRKYRTCIQEWFPHHNQEPFFSCIFDREHSDSYSWSLSKNGFFLFGGAFGIRGAAAAYENQKQKLRRDGFDMPEVPVKREACLVCRLRTRRDIRLGKDDILLIGEAAGFVSPSSFEGISGALCSAYILSRAFDEGAGNVQRIYRKTTFRLRLVYSFKIMKAGILGNSLLRRLIMKSRLKSIGMINASRTAQADAAGTPARRIRA